MNIEYCIFILIFNQNNSSSGQTNIWSTSYSQGKTKVKSQNIASHLYFYLLHMEHSGGYHKSTS